MISKRCKKLSEIQLSQRLPRLVIIKINQAANISMSNQEMGNNNELLESQRGFSQSSEIKNKFSINLNQSLAFLKDSLPIVPAFEESLLNRQLSQKQKALRFQRQYLKQFQKNQRLNSQLTEVIQDRNLLADKYNSIKATKTTEDSVHRKRRYAKDIERLFYCPIQKCRRGYGSEGSLSHHIRLKHMEFFQSGKYEIFIQKYLDDMKMKETKKKQEERTSLNKQIVQQIRQSLQKGLQISKKQTNLQNKKVQ